MKKLSDINMMEYEYEKRHQVRKDCGTNLFRKLDEVDLNDLNEKTPQEIQAANNLRNQKFAQDTLFKKTALKTKAELDAEKITKKLLLDPVSMEAKFADAKNVNDYNGILGRLNDAEYEAARIHFNERRGYVWAPNPDKKRRWGFAPNKDGYPYLDDKLTPGPTSAPQGPSVKVAENFDEYLHMIKVSPQKALEHITKQKDLNEFVAYLETLTQEQIDEKVENRGNYYTFKYKLATELGAYNKLQDKENIWNKIYCK